MRAWILYSALRLGLFIALCALLYAVTVTALGSAALPVSAIAAALLALCISFIFFKPVRDRVAMSVATARSTTPAAPTAKAGSDEDAEDLD